VCITVNLEKPGNVIATTLKWINLITQQVNSCLEEVRKSNPALAATIQENAKKRNKNAELLCPIPLLIFASKYDVFAHEDGIKRKALMCALRHVAHVHGASLLCTSTGDKTVMNQFRNMLNHYVFCTDLKVKVGTEPGAPLVIPSGGDTAESIGFPKSVRSQSDFDGQPVTMRLKKWEESVVEFFRPVEDESQSATTKDNSSSFVEPAVDALRAQKDEELRQYRKQVERKLKLAEASKAATSDKAEGKSSRRKSASGSKERKGGGS
jgi:dynein light intermediate chain 2